MTKLESGRLTFDFSKTHGPEAKASIGLVRTLRIPEDGKTYPLPAGLGRIDMQRTEGLKLPPEMAGKHAAFAPLHQGEAVYIDLQSGYPVMIRAYQGGVNMATGEVAAGPGGPLQTRGRDGQQDGYVQQPRAAGASQMWIDGVRKTGTTDQVRQLVAAPLGHGLTIEEQVKGTNVGSQGGLQFEVIPMDRAYYEKHVKPKIDAAQQFGTTRGITRGVAPVQEGGFGLGGNIKQKLVASDYPPEAWDVKAAQSVSMGVLNAKQWEQVSGRPIPREAPTPAQYQQAGLPWFDYNAGKGVNNGPTALDKVKTLGEKAVEQGLPKDQSGAIKIKPGDVIDLTPGATGDLKPWGAPITGGKRCPGAVPGTRGC